MASFYIMSDTWTRDLCIWHCTEWRHVGLVICASDIIQNDGMLDSWSVYLTFTEWCHVGLVICVSDIYRMMPCWTRDLCIWHLQNDAMLDSWSVYLTLYRMMPCWTRDLCIWHCTEWRHVGLVICASDIVQNDTMLDSWSVYLTLYRMTQWDHESNMVSFCTMSDAHITSPTWRHSVQCQMHRSRVQHCVILYNVRYTDHESNVASFCIMLDKQVISPTWHHSV